MIDIETELYNLIASAVLAEYPGAYVSNNYVPKPPSFPAVSIEEVDNVADRAMRDSGSTDNGADVLYEVNVYSNRNKDKKAVCKAVAALVDSLFPANFTRLYLRPVPNLNDPSIYRIQGRYTATVDKNKVIYRR